MQAFDVPKGFISGNIMKNIGMYIGKYVKVDPVSLDGSWKQYVRIRVTLDIQKSLKRRMKSRGRGVHGAGSNLFMKEWSIYVSYVGLLDIQECGVMYANPGKEIEKTYGV